MNDRELLELAAKAAGYQLLVDELGYHIKASEQDNWRQWYPLADDGDRYRLARTLGLRLDFEDCCVWKRFYDGLLIQEFWGGECGDEAHAVVRAAAEIGRSMQ